MKYEEHTWINIDFIFNPLWINCRPKQPFRYRKTPRIFFWKVATECWVAHQNKNVTIFTHAIIFWNTVANWMFKKWFLRIPVTYFILQRWSISNFEELILIMTCLFPSLKVAFFECMHAYLNFHSCVFCIFRCTFDLSINPFCGKRKECPFAW